MQPTIGRVRDEHGQENCTELEPVEHQRHREVADEERDDDKKWRGEEGDLRTRSDRDVDRQVHLVPGGEVDRDPVLGGVADDRHGGGVQIRGEVAEIRVAVVPADEGGGVVREDRAPGGVKGPRESWYDGSRSPCPYRQLS